MTKLPAKKPVKQTVAKQRQQSSQQLMTAENTAVPEWLRGYKGPLGTEGIDSEDVTIPRLKIGQSMSEEVKTGALQEGDLFLNVTGEALWQPGDDPLPFVIVALGKEYILWRPREDAGGGILARAKPVMEKGVRRYKWDNANRTYDVKVGGKVKVKWKTGRYVDEDGLAAWGSEVPGEEGCGPAATAHHNYIVVLPTKGNVVAAISMTRTGVKKAKDLNTNIKMRGGNVPLWASRWTLETIDDQNQNGDKFKNWRIKPAGFIDAKELPVYEQLAKGFANIDYKIDQSEADTDMPRGGRGEEDEGDM